MQIGIDLGGTRIEVIALDANTRPVVRRRVSTPRDYAATLDTITRLVAELGSETGKRGTVEPYKNFRA
jgi:fructokinase